MIKYLALGSLVISLIAEGSNVPQDVRSSLKVIAIILTTLSVVESLKS